MRKPNLRNTITSELITALQSINKNVNDDYLSDISQSVFFWGNPIVENQRNIQRVIVRDLNIEIPEDRYDAHHQAVYIKIIIGIASAENETTQDVHDKLINITDDIIYCIGINRDTLCHDTIDYLLEDIGDPDIFNAPYPCGEMALTLKVNFVNDLWLNND
jgi:hypothetical protein